MEKIDVNNLSALLQELNDRSDKIRMMMSQVQGLLQIHSMLPNIKVEEIHDMQEAVKAVIAEDASLVDLITPKEDQADGSINQER